MTLNELTGKIECPGVRAVVVDRISALYKAILNRLDAAERIHEVGGARKFASACTSISHAYDFLYGMLWGMNAANLITDEERESLTQELLKLLEPEEAEK